MTYKFFPACSLLVLKDDAGEQLFKLEQQSKLVKANFIKGGQRFIQVYPEYNLIITPHCLYTLQGKLIEEGDFSFVRAEEYHSFLVLFQQNPYQQSQIDSVWLWNGKEVVWHKPLQNIIFSEKYIALLQDCCWLIYTSKGKYTGRKIQTNFPIRIYGDMLVSDAVGCHNVYRIPEGKLIMQKQQLVKIASNGDFAIGVNLQCEAFVWHNGKTYSFNNVEFAEVIDKARIFYTKPAFQKGYDAYLYDFPDKPFVKNADLILFDKNNHNLLIVKDEIIRSYRTASNPIC